MRERRSAAEEHEVSDGALRLSMMEVTSADSFLDIPVSRSPESASIEPAADEIGRIRQRNPASGRDGDFDDAWIMARYMRTVIVPLREEEGHLTDVFGLEYDLRNRLQEPRSRRSADTDEIVDSLMQWCATAESRGIQALNVFVRELRTYTTRSPARPA